MQPLQVEVTSINQWRHECVHAEIACCCYCACILYTCVPADDEILRWIRQRYACHDVWAQLLTSAFNGGRYSRLMTILHLISWYEQVAIQLWTRSVEFKIALFPEKIQHYPGMGSVKGW